jgi:hypothetical protein
MCALTSAFGPEGEIVFIQTSQPEVVLGRIKLGPRVDAADVDIMETAPQKYLAVYCTDYEVYIYEPSLRKNQKR